MQELTLYGKYIIQGEIKVITGLHVGGPTTGLNIGGVDNIVIKDAEGRPYIPGSSLKGKMRSLLEKAEGLAGDDQRVWVVRPDEKGEGGVSIHMCNTVECKICNIFGRTPGEHPSVENGKVGKKPIIIESRNVTPSRLIVRDIVLDPKSLEKVKEKLDFEYTEVKWENVIDRVTSQANPRQMERVPPDAVFGTDDEPFEMIYNVFNDVDKKNLKYVFKAMNLLEQDYLGGSGTRGYGKIQFQNLRVFWNSSKDYEEGTIELTDKRKISKEYEIPEDILKHFDEIIR